MKTETKYLQSVHYKLDIEKAHGPVQTPRLNMKENVHVYSSLSLLPSESGAVNVKTVGLTSVGGPERR